MILQTDPTSLIGLIVLGSVCPAGHEINRLIRQLEPEFQKHGFEGVIGQVVVGEDGEFLIDPDSDVELGQAMEKKEKIFA